ncbi:MAG: ABC transporter ATP-binding protein [Acidimicrobiia bacterium]|nr:ABC transporter ATP-binding protein [Acidimicrobiia bacterium]NNF65525.1 ABC transporter ATP-binding protein [Acidimicrobiia bacterium]
MTYAVELRGVSKRFGEVVAVESLDLAIDDGEFFSLLGPSGCGKTTTLRMIAGFEYPTEGSLAIHGTEMALQPPNQRPVNTVFQSYALFPHMTIAENVGFGLLMQKVAKSEISTRVDRALDMVQLSQRKGATPDKLSGGQQQRVALARALVNEPEVLLLDEPLGALDLKLRQQMQIELKELQERVGITFVYVTHDQEEALTMSDRIGVMSDGRLLQVGDATEIYERPTSRFVADFIGDINLLPAAITGPGVVTLAGTTPVSAPSAVAGNAANWLALRPEQLHLIRHDEIVPDDRNSISGTVNNRVYFGDSYYYVVATPVGALDVRQENRPGLALHDPGTSVHVWWHPDAAAMVLE